MYFDVREDQHILHLRFHAPTSSNALSHAAALELATLRKKYSKWSGLVVVSSAHPRLFCSGGNLSDYKKMKGKAPGLTVNREITKALDAFAAWPAVKLALVEGDVLGGGMEWLARFDFRWCTPYVLFSFWQKRIGLSPGWGGGRAWAGLIGEAQVRKLLLEARLLGVDRALALGLVDRIASAETLRAELVGFAESMSGATAKTLGAWTSKREAAVFQALWLGPEHKRALDRWRKS